MVPEGRETTETFLTHREEIFAAFGSHLWPDEAQAVRRKRMKATTNAYDMDAGANIWERRFGNPRKRTLRGVTKTLSDGTKFSMEAYQKAQGGSTDWLWFPGGRGAVVLHEALVPAEREEAQAEMEELRAAGS